RTPLPGGHQTASRRPAGTARVPPRRRGGQVRERPRLGKPRHPSHAKSQKSTHPLHLDQQRERHPLRNGIRRVSAPCPARTSPYFSPSLPPHETPAHSSPCSGRTRSQQLRDLPTRLEKIGRG